MSNKVITEKVRFSYANVWEPKSINGSDPKYSVSLIISKEDKTTLKKVKQAINEAKKDGVAKLGGKIPANLKTPLRDGDIDRPDDEAYADSYFINANSNTKPGIVDKNVQPILDQSEFYSGCYGRASIIFYAYNANGNKGIACGLQNLQKTEDGESLGGRSRAEDDFDAVEDDFLD
jgi:ssDNA-binding protein